MSIKLYILTYNNAPHLNGGLASLFATDIKDFSVEVFILNNHTSINLDPNFKDRVTVIQNQGSPNFSCGNLARSWNTALIHGFVNPIRPEADIVVHAQDDTQYSPNFFKLLTEHHKKYSFIQAGRGDNVCSYTVDAVRAIGLWDERFCNNGVQEGDYFVRALKFNRDSSSINDAGHGRELNPIKDFIAGRLENEGRHWAENQQSPAKRHYPYLEKLSLFKYGICPGNHDNRAMEGWTAQFLAHPPEVLSPQTIMYPYFECDIPDLDKKGYLVL